MQDGKTAMDIAHEDCDDADKTAVLGLLRQNGGCHSLIYAVEHVPDDVAAAEAAGAAVDVRDEVMHTHTHTHAYIHRLTGIHTQTYRHTCLRATAVVYLSFFRLPHKVVDVYIICM